MPNSNIANLRPANNVTSIKVPEPTDNNPISIGELIVNLPEFIQTSINLILNDFDYSNNLTSDTAIAIRLLSLTADRLNSSLGNCHE